MSFSDSLIVAIMALKRPLYRVFYESRDLVRTHSKSESESMKNFIDKFFLKGTRHNQIYLLNTMDAIVSWHLGTTRIHVT